jgi:hypothetical protein
MNLPIIILFLYGLFNNSILFVTACLASLKPSQFVHKQVSSFPFLMYQDHSTKVERRVKKFVLNGRIELTFYVRTGSNLTTFDRLKGLAFQLTPSPAFIPTVTEDVFDLS